VVSRVTLWINGEPCEAAFGGRSQTRQAYQQVAVRQRRDPVLVTTAGPDRILMQCFPVPVDGAMKTRIGITVPLLVPDADKAEAALRLPRFVEQNFSAAPDLQTAVWLESDQPASDVQGATNGFLVLDGDPYSIRGKAPVDSSKSAPVLRLPRILPYPPVVSRDARLGADEAILQTLEIPQHSPAFPEALAIVIDGSARMKAHHAHMTQCIFDFLPAETRVRTWIAYDEPRAIDGPPPRSVRFVGGCDNGFALVQAAEWAAANGNAPILWLHAAQPLDSPSLEALRQIADFSRGGLAIHSHQYGPGANRIAEALADSLMHRSGPPPGRHEGARFGLARDALVRRLERLSGSLAARITIVFDGRERGGLSESHTGPVEVASRPATLTADSTIERLVHDCAAPETITVITSDRRERETVEAAGARSLSCGDFLALCDAEERRLARAAPPRRRPGPSLAEFFPTD
jgi:predicted RNA-binding protein with PIN domain